MKVAFMLGSLNRGGTEMLLLDVCRNLQGTGIEGFVYHRKEGMLESSFKETGVPMLFLSPNSVKGIFSYILRLRKSFKVNKIEIIHAQQNIDALFAIFASLGTRRKVVQTFHGYDFNYRNPQRMLMWLSVFLCNASYFVSKTQREYYLKQYKIFKKRNTAVIYNGIDFNRIRNAAESTILEEYDVNDKTLKLAMVGNFVPVRSQMIVCKGLKLIHDKDIDFRFFFIGAKDSDNPQLYDDCRRFCSDNDLESKVVFTGSRSDVPGILKQLHAFVYSSDHDTFGIAVIEAMAAGVPVFVNDWKVMTEITESEVYANIYKSGNKKELASIITKFVLNPEKFIEKAKLAKAYVLEKYSIEKHIRNLEANYSKLRVP